MSRDDQFTKIKFIPSAAVMARPDKYKSVMVDTNLIIKDWEVSIRSFEWLNGDGSIKALEALSERDQERRTETEKAHAQGSEIEQPVLGIGLMENVELGSGRAVFLTLTDLGASELPVHIPLSNEKDFAKFIIN